MGLGINTNTDTHERDAFDDFLDSLKEPRQVMDKSDQDAPPVDDITTDQSLGDCADYDETPAEQKKRFNLSIIPAETLVNCVDIAMVQVTSIIAKEKVEGATDEEKESLIQAAANYMKEKDIDISPGAMLVVMVIVIYAPKIYNAVQLRKANELIEAQQLELQRQREEIKRLKENKDE